MRGPLSARISDEEVSGGSGPLESAHVKHEQVPPGSRKLTGDEEASGVRTRPPLLYTELQLAHTHLEQPPSLPTRPVRDHFRGACLDVEASSSDVSALLLPYVYGNAVGLKLDESGHVHSDGVHFSVQQTHKYAGPDYDLIRSFPAPPSLSLSLSCSLALSLASSRSSERGRARALSLRRIGVLVGV